MSVDEEKGYRQSEADTGTEQREQRIETRIERDLAEIAKDTKEIERLEEEEHHHHHHEHPHPTLVVIIVDGTPTSGRRVRSPSRKWSPSSSRTISRGTGSTTQ